jgi:hypothetical protein
MNTLEAALRYRELGWSVIPMKTGVDPETGDDEKKKPCVKWKKYQTELPSESDLRYWFGKKWPNANIALICGKFSGVFAIDFDSQEALEYYKATYDMDVEMTMCQKSGRDGLGIHALFKVVGDAPPLITGVLNKTDLKGEGSYIMVEPSIHETGRQYQWTNLNPLTDGTDDILDSPLAVNQMVQDYKDAMEEKNSGNIKGKKKKQNREGWEQELLMGVKESEEGGRDVAATKLAGLYLAKDYEQGDTLTLLLRWNERNTPPLSEKDIKKVVRSIYGEHAKKTAMGISEAVEKITILRYPDGKNKYKMHLGHGRSTLLTMEDLMSSRRTTIRIADTTKAIFYPPKQGKWLALIRIWLDAADEKKVSVEESELGIIKEIMSEWLIQWNRQKDSEHIDHSAMLKNCCIVQDGILYFTLTHIEEDLRFKNIRMTRTMLCELLRSLGARVTEPRVRFGKSRSRTWDIKEDCFE